MFGAIGLCGAAVGWLVVVSFFGAAFWVFDLVGSYRPQLSLTALTLGAASLLGRAWRTGATALVAGLAGAMSLMPHLAAGPVPIAEGSPTITVLTFNVGISNPSRSDVASFIAEADPDVVFIFESSFEWEDTIRASGLPLQIVSIVPRGRMAGVTVLARPDLRPGRIDVDIAGEVSGVSVDLGNERIEVLGIHPLSPTTAARAAARDGLIGEAARWVAGRTGPVVVVGDLNATPWSPVFTRLRVIGGLSDTLRGRGFQPTWPAGWGAAMIPIDHVLHTDGLGSDHRRTGPALGSAHRPVVVEIGFSG